MEGHCPAESLYSRQFSANLLLRVVFGRNRKVSIIPLNTEKLLLSVWNAVHMVLAPAQKEELRYIEITLETNIVRLTERLP